jgi:hypothetical protein
MPMIIVKRIISWWQARRRPPWHLKFILYTRNGCHLCDEALMVLSAERQRWGFNVETVDIDGDVGLKEKYGECVPVLALDGKVYFRGRINRVLLRRLLAIREARATSRSAPQTPHRG